MTKSHHHVIHIFWYHDQMIMIAIDSGNREPTAGRHHQALRRGRSGSQGRTLAITSTPLVVCPCRMPGQCHHSRNWERKAGKCVFLLPFVLSDPVLTPRSGLLPRRGFPHNPQRAWLPIKFFITGSRELKRTIPCGSANILDFSLAFSRQGAQEPHTLVASMTVLGGMDFPTPKYYLISLEIDAPGDSLGHVRILRTIPVSTCPERVVERARRSGAVRPSSA